MPTCIKPYFGIVHLFESYLKSIGPLKTLTAEEERELFKQYWSGSETAFYQIVLGTQYIVFEEVIYFKEENIEIQDLLQEANLGCLIAIKNYKENHGNLKNYLHHNIYRHLDNFTRTSGNLVRLPMNVVSELRDMKEDLDEYFTGISENQTLGDFESYCIDHDYDNDFVKLYFNDSYQIYFNQYLNRVDFQLDDIDLESYTLPDKNLYYESLKQDTTYMLSGLSEKSAEVIKLYYGIEGEHSATLEEIGERFNLTRERIRQILKQSLDQIINTDLRKTLDDYLSYFYFKKPFRIPECYLFNNHFEDEEHVIALLEKYIQPRRRVTSYPGIKNLSSECRIQIVNILDNIGRPLTAEEITDLILEKYPLLNQNIIYYALKTAKSVIRIDNTYYALDRWDYLQAINNKKIELLDNSELIEHIERILTLQNIPVSFEYLLSILANKYKKNVFSTVEEKQIDRVLNKSENIIKTLDDKYYLLNEDYDE